MPDRDQPVSLVDRRDFLKIAGSLAATGVLGSLAGCWSNQPVTIASHVWPGYEFMFLARQMGWLKSEDVTLVETQNATESLQALVDGKVIGAALTLDETLRGIKMGLPLSVVLLFDVSTGGDVVISRVPITTPSDLKGVRVGVETSALGALMLNKFLKHTGLSRRDVEVVKIRFDEHLLAWKERKLDVIVTYEPVAMKIESTGGIRIFDSRAIPNTIFDVLAINRDKASRYERQITSLVEANFRALRAWKTNPVDTSYRLSKRLGVSADEVGVLYRGLELPDLIFNRHLLTPPAQDLTNVTREIADILDYSPELVTSALFQADFLPRDAE